MFVILCMCVRKRCLMKADKLVQKILPPIKDRIFQVCPVALYAGGWIPQPLSTSFSFVLALAPLPLSTWLQTVQLSVASTGKPDPKQRGRSISLLNVIFTCKCLVLLPKSVSEHLGLVLLSTGLCLARAALGSGVFLLFFKDALNSF